MKTLLPLLFFVGVLISCDDDNDTPFNNDSLNGHWALKVSCGGFAGCIYSPQADHAVMTITSSEMKATANGKATFDKHYTITSIITGDKFDTYYLKFSDGTETTCTVSTNSLSFGNIDFNTTYTRVFHSHGT